jgi:hypothetical protein
MAKSGRSLSELAAEIERRADAKKDFIAHVERIGGDVITLAPGQWRELATV